MCEYCAMKRLDNNPDLEQTSLSALSQGGVSIHAASFNSGTGYINALLDDFTWTGTTGQSATVNYSFGVSREGGTLFNATKQAAAVSVMTQWSNVANINFQSSSNANAKLTFSSTSFNGDATFLGLATTYYSGTSITSSEVQTNSNISAYGVGSEGYLTLLHEVGHAIGLKHPGAYSPTDTGPYLSVSEDTIQATVMSYNEGLQANFSNNPSTPMIYDIAAVQYIYGANTSYNNTNTTYSFSGALTAQTIWDGGGIDNLSATGAATPVTLDLNAGINNVSTIGQAKIWIAFNANIENAQGGAGGDTITGNTLNNALYGFGSNDTLNGGLGNDLLFGGSGETDPTDGSDVLIGSSGNDTVYGNAGNDTIFGGNGTTDTTDANDSIFGGLGSDLIYGNAGNDWIVGGGGNSDPSDNGDTIYGGKGSDLLSGNGGNDVIYGGGGTTDAGDDGDSIYGGVGDDLIYGNGGNDIIYGGPGNDTMSGGVGYDGYYVVANDGIDTILNFDNVGAAIGDLVYLSSALGLSASQAAANIVYGTDSATLDLGGGNKIIFSGITSGFTFEDFAIF